MSGIQQVSASSASASAATALITVFCPGGKVAIGGGATIFGGGTSVALYLNQPATNVTGGLIGWVGGGFETAAYDPNWHVTAYAICAFVS